MFNLYIYFFSNLGCSERHATDLHHSISVHPQTLPWPLVPRWKPVRLRLDNTWRVRHGHWVDHDGPLPSRLFTRRGDVLLCRRQCLRHGTTCMTGISSQTVWGLATMKGNPNATDYSDMFDNIVLPILWQQFVLYNCDFPSLVWKNCTGLRRFGSFGISFGIGQTNVEVSVYFWIIIACGIISNIIVLM